MRKTIGSAARRLRFLLRHGLSANIRDYRRRRHLGEDQEPLKREYVRRLFSEAPEEVDPAPAASLKFSVITPVYNTPESVLREMICSVREQTWPCWELCLADGSDGDHPWVQRICEEAAGADPRVRYLRLRENGGISGNSNAALAMATGEYLVLLDHDDRLMPDALREVARCIRTQGADFIYSDEMIFASPDVSQVIGIRLKPDYAPDFLLSNNYICHLAAFDRKLLEKAGAFRPAYDGCQDYDLFLRLTRAARKVAHIPRVLYLWRAIPGSVAAGIQEKDYVADAGRRAIHDFLRDSEGVETEVAQTCPAMFRIRYPVSEHPSVRMIVELQSAEKAAWESFRRRMAAEGIQTSAVRAGGKARAEALGEAAAEATEDYLLFVQGIPEATDSAWVRELLMLAAREHVGAVGARILTPENAVRHAGIVLGMGDRGLAGRPYYRMDGNSAGYFSQQAVVQNVSGVSCECMMVNREKYEQTGGFDPGYRDSLFDLDLCLRLRELGYYNALTPFAVIRSGSETDFRFDFGEEYASYPEDAGRFRNRWDAALRRGDPFYHPDLSLRFEDWRLRSSTETETGRKMEQ